MLGEGVVVGDDLGRTVDGLAPRPPPQIPAAARNVRARMDLPSVESRSRRRVLPTVFGGALVVRLFGPSPATRTVWRRIADRTVCSSSRLALSSDRNGLDGPRRVLVVLCWTSQTLRPGYRR